MHYSHIVALPGDIDSDKLETVLYELMYRFDENRRVDWHRDTSPYAEPRDVQIAKAKASERFAEWGTHLTDDEIATEWNGSQRFDTDGWPLTNGNPYGHWDWWVIGGRWSGEWTLRNGNPVDGPVRLSDLMPESIRPPYSWIDLDGQWHTRWIGPTVAEATDELPSDYASWEVPVEQSTAEFLSWIATLPKDAWLVHIDYHS